MSFRTAARAFTSDLVGLVVALSALASTTPAQAAHPHALWHVVHDLCTADQSLTGLPAPCLEVNVAAGYAVVPDPQIRTHLLLVPTRRISGIEDPQLLEAGAPNYWRQAWMARRHLTKRVVEELPRKRVGLAVNAIAGRSQDQLHIHLSCVQPEVAQALKALAPELGEKWSDHQIQGREWRIRTVTEEQLAEKSPFRLLADSAPAIAGDMGQQTLVLVGASVQNRPGFYLLSRSIDNTVGYHGHGEYLLDETCSVSPTG